MKKKVTKSAASKKNQKVDWTRHCKNPSDKIKKQLDIIMSKGLPVNDYFSLLNGGSQQLYRYDKSGIPTVVNDNDPDVTIKRIKKEIQKIAEEIKADIEKNGYVKNTKLHRRFVMAHFFHMLYDRRGYREALKSLGYEYSWEMAVEEYRVLSILEKNDKECFEERSPFFNKDVAREMIIDDSNTMSRCLGSESGSVIGRRYMSASEIRSKISFASDFIDKIANAESFREIYEALRDYNKTVRIKKSHFAQSPAWRSAYERNGAYYTLKNMLMFHNCHIDVNDPQSIETEVDNLKGLVDTKRLDHVLVDDFAIANGFNFTARMREIYGH